MDESEQEASARGVVTIPGTNERLTGDDRQGADADTKPRVAGYLSDAGATKTQTAKDRTQLVLGAGMTPCRAHDVGARLSMTIIASATPPTLKENA